MKKILLLFVFACFTMLQANAQKSSSFDQDIQSLLELNKGTDFYKNGIESLKKVAKDKADFASVQKDLMSHKNEIMSTMKKYVKSTFSHQDVKDMIKNIKSGEKLSQNSTDFSRRWRAIKGNFDRAVKKAYQQYIQ
ncbi:hypothetical protein [Aureivirga sp. CE67]|uniref:hypothetical protein n=1 Tax=Aureivirga sp. CE67 TaxID=1788983 RepID=UPI0018CA2F9C|nr:hypothetical protein [Aureivirga sp. CE67]